MELEDVAKEPSGIIEDSTLSGMTLYKFMQTLTPLMFPGYISIRVEKRGESPVDLDSITDRTEKIVIQLRQSSVYSNTRRYILTDYYGNDKEVPEYRAQDALYGSALNDIEGVSYHAFSKHPDYLKAMVLVDIINHVQRFLGIRMFGFDTHSYKVQKARAVNDIKEFDAAIKTGVENAREAVMAAMKFITAYYPTMAFVDALAEDESHHEEYVELVQFVHKYLPQQDNAAKFEL